MTRDEILAMEPGRELDALVAERVMGWRKKTFPGGGGGYTAWVNKDGEALKLVSNFTMIETCHRCDYFRPSIDIAAAWEVEEEIERQNKHVAYCKALKIVLYSKDEYVWMFDYVHASPADRCKAALLAVMDHD